MAVWQVAAGEPGRDYTQVFLDYDIMLIGPGRAGPHPKKGANYSKRTVNQNKRFAEKPKGNDVVLLRFRKEIRAVGLIKGYYVWLDMFSDVLGWDLQHSMRVVWTPIKKKKLKEITEREGIFTNVIGPMHTFSKTNEFAEYEKELKEYVTDRPPGRLPDIPPPLERDDIKHRLFANGFPEITIEAIIKTIESAKALNEFYKNPTLSGDKRPSEHELVAFVLIPLFEGLGWSKQLLAVEWNNIDLAIFKKTPTNPSNCIIICEAKKRGGILSGTYEQALKYVGKYKLSNVSKLITTDGERVFVYSVNYKGGTASLQGYINFANIRETDIILKDFNSFETLLSLTRFGNY